MRRSVLLCVALAAAAMGAVPALAHHTGAAVDFSKQVRLQGTVKEWQFTNPHSWLDIVVTYPNGQSQSWAFETGSVNGLIRRGWTSRSILPGEKVTVLAFPLKDGRTGGRLVQVIKADGKIVGEQLGSKD